jgi:hypothetical protein
MKKKVLKKVRVRMYRQGLGDCFLLTFTNADKKQHHMLIDCGVLPLSSGASGRLDLIAQDILAETGRHLDVVAATHEHADHLSGFRSASEFFGLDPKKPPDEPVQVDKIWLAWTENKDDEQVKKILAKTNSLALAVAAAAQGLGPVQSQAIRDILLFEGALFDSENDLESDQGSPAEPLAVEGEEARTDQGDQMVEGAALDQSSRGKPKFKIARTMAQIMDWLRGWGPVDYLEPGDVRDLPEFGIKFYILGPSRRMTMLGGSSQDDQAAAMRHPGQRLKSTQSTAFLAAATAFAGLELDEAPGEGLSKSDIDAVYQLSLPFDPARSLSLEEAKKPYPLAEDPKYPEKLQAAYRDFFREVYGFGDESEGYGPEWRRIDTDWLQMGETLALQQVSTINNTSLVMAIELVEKGKVMLFVGDAEEENWRTWENKNADLEQLLAKTVLYKVGHHGSINATDLEILNAKMTNPELVALIPVDMKRAAEKKWQFPAKSLYDPSKADDQKGALFKRTLGRIILNCVEDGCMDRDPGFDEDRPWPGKIATDRSPEKLWIDYTFTF